MIPILFLQNMISQHSFLSKNLNKKPYKTKEIAFILNININNGKINITILKKAYQN